MEQPVSPLFNNLSGLDRMKLKSAAFAVAVTGFMHEDVKTRPWRFPFYASYVGLYMVAMVSPVPLVNIALMAGTLAWAKRGRGPTARALNNHLQRAFNDVALIAAFRHCIVAAASGTGQNMTSPGQPASFRVSTRGVLRDSYRSSMDHCKASAGLSWQAFRNKLNL